MLKNIQPAGIALMILAGCATTGSQAARPAANQIAEDGPPDWLMKLPVGETGTVYAVGIAGPTYYPDDGVRNAGDNGRVQLAHVLSTKVTAATLSINTTSGSTVDTASVVDATHDYTEAIVQFSEVVSTWVDQSGRHSSGQSGTSYALVRLNLKDAGLLAAPPPKNASAQ